MVNGSVEGLRGFYLENENAFEFSHLSADDKTALLTSAMDLTSAASKGEMGEEKRVDLQVLCGGCARILSRCKEHANAMMSPSNITKLFQYSGIAAPSKTGEGTLAVAVQLEFAKALSNFLFNSPACRVEFTKSSYAASILQQVTAGGRAPLNFFHLKSLFISTALSTNFASAVYTKHCDELLSTTERSASDSSFICELLKILYNVISHRPACDQTGSSIEDLTPLCHAARLCRQLCATMHDDLEVTSHVINLMSSLPQSVADEFSPPITEGTSQSAVTYEGHDVTTIHNLLDFLRTQLTPKGTREALVPVLFCLTELSRSQRAVRRYCRHVVLPPLKATDVQTMPQVGSTLRNQLVSLFTTTFKALKDNAALFVFVLCKEDVARMVKYTGFGNAAGLLTDLGLLAGGRIGTSEYSDDDSDTEDYSRVEAGVNPVTGHVTGPMPDPTADWSDERKEYEMEQLLTHIDKLQRSGVIAPATIGEDGKPVAVSHVLELLDNDKKIPKKTDS